MIDIAEFIFWTSLILLIYVYGGYLVILTLLYHSAGWFGAFAPKKRQRQEPFSPSVSVIIAAYNEENNIIVRLEDVSAQRFPREKIQIIVASDGSDDNTSTLVNQYAHRHPVSLLDFKDRRGRSSVHNDAVDAAEAEIVVFTDADTQFDRNFIACIVAPFSDPAAGCVVGNLYYKTDRSDVSTSEGLYWKYEKRLRKLESRLGLLATGTGACMAVRKSCWCRLGPVDDVDFILPLHALKNGYSVVYAEDAVAYDIPSGSIRAEFNTRIRQTSRNLPGTLLNWGPRQWITHPLITWSLVSHKLIRWFSFYLMMALLLSNVMIRPESPVYAALLAAQSLFYVLAGLGMVCAALRLKSRMLGSIYTFIIATAGMAIGVVKAALGAAPMLYDKPKAD